MARSGSTRNAEPSVVWRPLAASSVRICKSLPRAASKIRSAVEETGAGAMISAPGGGVEEVSCAKAGRARPSSATASKKTITKREASTILRPIMAKLLPDASGCACRPVEARLETIQISREGRMADLQLSIAMHPNARSRPVLEGKIKPDGIDLFVTNVHPSEIF